MVVVAVDLTVNRPADLTLLSMLIGRTEYKKTGDEQWKETGQMVT